MNQTISPAHGGSAIAVRRVLIVDDDRVIRQCLADTLQEEGYEAITAAHGAEALDLVLSGIEPPDVILLDMRMPVMDGWAFARQYHSLPVRHAPIIVITAAHDSLDRVVEIGAHGVLPKPFDIENVIAAVDGCLASRQR